MMMVVMIMTTTTMMMVVVVMMTMMVMMMIAGGRTTPHGKLPPEQHSNMLPAPIEEHPPPSHIKCAPGVLSSPAEEEERISLLDRSVS